VREPISDQRSAGILVVDDEPANVQLLERILGQAGHTNVRGITDPRQVAHALDEFHADIVLLDLLMPHMDGFAVMEHLRSRISESSRLPILVLTADITTDSKRHSLAAGASDFLTKPFDHVEVLLRVKNLLDTHFLYLRVISQNELLETTVKERTRELRESFDDLRRIDEQRRLLLSHLVDAQEDERRRIAADVHDDSIQQMVAVGLRLSGLRPHLADPDAANVLERLEETVRQAIARLRHLVFELRPPALESEGLAAAIAQYAHESRLENGFELHMENRLIDEPSTETRATAYRIAQEALVNVRKHARAHRVDVILEAKDRGLYVQIRDDGQGIPPHRLVGTQVGHLGCTAMRERAELAGGWWTIGSAGGRGRRWSSGSPRWMWR